jgi:EcoEI R protein C-terminal
VKGASRQRILTDLVSLVRFAMQQDNELVPYPERVAANFKAWLAQQNSAPVRPEVSKDKGYSKPVNADGKVEARVQFDGARLTFPMFKTSKPLEQAERQGKWVSQWLSKSTGSPVTATPVLALPGWFVEQMGSSPVRIYSGKQLNQLLNVRGTVRLSEERVQSIAYQVEQRCRTVPRAFAPLDEKAT